MSNKNNNTEENGNLKKDLDETEATSEGKVSEEYEEYNEKESNERKNKDSDNVEDISDAKSVKNIKKENSKLKDENEKLKNELDTLKDRLARTSAEYDNFRKRTAKEKENIYTESCEDILKDILPVLDNLERAIAVEGNKDDLKKGVEMTMKQFNDALKKLDVEEIPADGEFDPHMHNAVMHIEDDSYDKNFIAEVFQKGYKRGDKVLRYSMVKVAN
ncbi:nucleotide exchange factor GrpE [Clostridium tyrobutyricum]|uniref:nucleotide exchange factor GrpE n=1 Tax=Clostridium tyrobutyricum TaxID=1519 RepID=UPI001C384DD5|nr:nucleotide exchange factor GrpE [Clostridium tyrobutyricum]MBV4419964.1 nucleotide exchange factor GrpE [Clostridium tyrobutyricum]